MKRSKAKSKKRGGRRLTLGVSDLVTPTTRVAVDGSRSPPRTSGRKMSLADLPARGEVRRFGLADFVAPTTRMPLDGSIPLRREPRRMGLSDLHPRGERRRKMGLADFRSPTSIVDLGSPSLDSPSPTKSASQIKREIREILGED